MGQVARLADEGGRPRERRIGLRRTRLLGDAERGLHRRDVLGARRLVGADRHVVGVDQAQVDAAGLGRRHHLVGTAGHPYGDGVEEVLRDDLDAAGPQGADQRGRMAVHPTRDRGQAGRAVPDGVHAGHDREQDLRGADVGGRLLAADVLLAGLQGQAVGACAVRVHAHADQSAGHRPLQAGPDAHEAGVRAAEAHRHAEALARAHRDVSPPLPGWGREGQRQQVGGGGDQRAGPVGRGGEGCPVAQLAVGAGVLHEDAEHGAAAGGGGQALGVGDRGQVGDHGLQTQRSGPGLDHGHRLRQRVLIDEQHRVLADLAGPAHQRHRLGSGGALIQQRGPGRGQAGQVHDDGLEVQQRLEPALGDLRLVRRVGGVPGRVLQHVAADHRRGQGAVVAQADHRGQHGVARGELAQLPDHGRLARRRVDVERPTGPDDAGQRRVQQGGDAGLADDLQHGGDVVLAGPDVARDELGLERGGGVRGHDRLLTRATPCGGRRSGLPPHLSPEIGSRVPARAVLAPERFRGGLPLRRPGRSLRATRPWSWRWCAGTLPHGVDQRAQPNIRVPPGRRFARPTAGCTVGTATSPYGGRRRPAAAASADQAGLTAGPQLITGVHARRLVLGTLAGQLQPARPRPRARPGRRRCRTRPGRPAPGR